MRQPNLNKVSSKGRGTRAISKLYRDLSACLEVLQDVESQCEELSQQVFCTVLQEDLSALLEECEEDLIMGIDNSGPLYFSLKARSKTVIEEFYGFLCRQSWGMKEVDAALNARRAYLQ